MSLRVLAVGLFTLFSATSALAQAQIGRDAIERPAALSEYEGLYRYRDGGQLIMVADRERLVALIGEAKYPLRAVAKDTFANPGGDRIPFVRDRTNRIVAFKESGETFARLSTEIAPEARKLLVPRPPGPDGRPEPYRCTAPSASDDGIRVGAMGSGTLTCAVAEQVVNGVLDGTYPDVRAIAVHHKGALVLEEYFYGYDRERPHQMRSLTKSVIALLAGAAIDRGRLRADEPVIARLGYPSTANPDARKERITLRDLLSNQSGLACNDRDGASPGNEVKLYETADWPQAFMDLPIVAEPGTIGRYCSFGFMTAGRMVERAVAQPLPEFAQDALFGPVGIARDQWRWAFVLDRSQRNEFGQIHLRPRDMLKLGLLIRSRGVWQGRQVVSASWIDAAVAKVSTVDDSDYGLGIWHRWYGVATAAGRQRVETIMLSGNGGQKVYIVPSLDLVVVFTGGAFNAESPVNTLMAGVLLPALLETVEQPVGGSAARRGATPPGTP
ncbi:MAG: serine hydrolase [Gemmatimonadaceae bacterium]|nr:serine hydrolase [Gemmatimonadaceae bacterium]